MNKNINLHRLDHLLYF